MGACAVHIHTDVAVSMSDVVCEVNTVVTLPMVATSFRGDRDVCVLSRQPTCLVERHFSINLIHAYTCYG
jgi:hypothetical protein